MSEGEDPPDVLRKFRDAERRGEPVTLEEMTRRRDGWRARWERTDQELRKVTIRNGLLEKQMDAVKYRDASNAAEIRRLQGELAAAQAEARRFAEECGRLRDLMATPRVREQADG